MRTCLECRALLLAGAQGEGLAGSYMLDSKESSPGSLQSPVLAPEIKQGTFLLTKLKVTLSFAEAVCNSVSP